MELQPTDGMCTAHESCMQAKHMAGTVCVCLYDAGTWYEHAVFMCVYVCVCT